MGVKQSNLYTDDKSSSFENIIGITAELYRNNINPNLMKQVSRKASKNYNLKMLSDTLKRNSGKTRLMFFAETGDVAGAQKYLEEYRERKDLLNQVNLRGLSAIDYAFDNLLELFKLFEQKKRLSVYSNDYEKYINNPAQYQKNFTTIQQKLLNAEKMFHLFLFNPSIHITPYILNNLKEVTNNIKTPIRPFIKDILKKVPLQRLIALSNEHPKMTKKILEYFVREGDLDFIQYIVNQGIVINPANVDSLMIAAIGTNNLPIVKYLVESHGGSVSAEPIFDTLLRFGDAAMISYLVQRTTFGEYEMSELLEKAIHLDDAELVELLILKNGLTQDKKEDFIGRLFRKRNPSVIRKFIEHGLGNDLLSFAVAKGDTEFINILMNNGLHLEKSDRDLLLLRFYKEGDIDSFTEMKQLFNKNKGGGKRKTRKSKH